MIKTVRTACPSCGSNDDRELFRGREHEYEHTTDELFPVVRCCKCGLVRLSPRPDVSELSRIYPPEYYAYHLVEREAKREKRAGVTSLLQSIKARRHQKYFEDIISRVSTGSERLRVLDIGCGDGRLLDFYRASKVGNKIETWGVDMDESSVRLARERGHHAVHGRFEETAELENASFDVILTSHVIEHVEDPVDFCRRARDLLVPGGVFVVATPNFDSADVRFFGRNWGGCHFPRHWTFFDPNTLSDVARKLGMRTAHVTYDPNPFFWVWTCHSWLRERFPQGVWVDKLFPTVSVFHASLHSFILLSFFTLVDMTQRAFTGQTASMTLEIEKDRAAS